MNNVEAIKQALGIEKANCISCCHIGSEGDGPEYNGNWYVCTKIDKYSYLKSFPFKKTMKCWFPDFWHSKFTDMIKHGTDKEILSAIDACNKALESVKAD